MPHNSPRLAVILAALAISAFLWIPLPVQAQGTITPMSLDEMHDMLASDEPLVVSLMTSWCGPCKNELVMLNGMYAEFAEQGLEFIGISLDIAPEQMAKMLENVPADFPFYWVGEVGLTELEVNAVPQLYLVRDGGVYKKLVGLMDEEELRVLLVEMLEQKH